MNEPAVLDAARRVAAARAELRTAEERCLAHAHELRDLQKAREDVRARAFAAWEELSELLGSRYPEPEPWRPEP